jgi:hypothetical protein
MINQRPKRDFRVGEIYRLKGGSNPPATLTFAHIVDSGDQRFYSLRFTNFLQKSLDLMISEHLVGEKVEFLDALKERIEYQAKHMSGMVDVRLRRLYFKTALHLGG